LGMGVATDDTDRVRGGLGSDRGLPPVHPATSTTVPTHAVSTPVRPMLVPLSGCDRSWPLATSRATRPWRASNPFPSVTWSRRTPLREPDVGLPVAGPTAPCHA